MFLCLISFALNYIRLFSNTFKVLLTSILHVLIALSLLQPFSAHYWLSQKDASTCNKIERHDNIFFYRNKPYVAQRAMLNVIINDVKNLCFINSPII